MMRNIFKKITTTISVIILTLIIAGGAIFGLGISGFSCVQISSDINEYGLFYEIRQIYNSERVIFPKSLDNVAAVNDYKFLYDTFFGGYQILLDVSYDEETFQEEIEYWKDYKYSDNLVSDRQLKFDNAYLFNYPTYVAHYHHSCYQYMSIIENENRIVYVLMKEVDENIVIPKSFLPKNYFQNLEDSAQEKDGYHFNIESTVENWYE